MLSMYIDAPLLTVLLLANQCPGIARGLNLPGGSTPVSVPLLGSNKTIAAYYLTPIGGLCAVYLEKYMHWFPYGSSIVYTRPDLWLLGLALGFGVVLGDHLKSFVKRRCGIVPGARWWPWDALDFLIGGVACATPLIGWIGWSQLGVLCACVLVIHALGNAIGYRIGLRSVPW